MSIEQLVHLRLDNTTSAGVRPARARKVTIMNAIDGGLGGIFCSTLLPVGTRIQFIRTMIEGPDEDGPARLYATKGEYGTITGHGTKEGYWVKRDCWPAAFGAAYGTEFIAVDA